LQCSSRSLSSLANYTFDGSNAQVTGSYLPANINDFTIDNSGGVTLTNGVTVGGIQTLTSGVLSLNGKALVIATTGSSICSGTGTINGDAGSSFVLYSSGVASLPQGTYQDVTINVVTPMSLVPLCGNATVNGTLNLSNGILNLVR
jgi:hypothetical protein